MLFKIFFLLALLATALILKRFFGEAGRRLYLYVNQGGSHRITHSKQPWTLSFLTLGSLLALILLSLHAFKSNFDVTDEGFQLALLLQGTQSTFLNFHYAFLQPLGSFLHLNLYGWRVLHLLIALGAGITAGLSAEFSTRRTRRPPQRSHQLIFASIGAIGTLTSFSASAVLAYTPLAMAGIVFWTSGCWLILAGLKRGLGLAVMGAFLASAARPPLFPALLGAGALWIYLAETHTQRSKRHAGAYLMLLLGSGLLAAFIWQDLFLRIFELYPTQATATHAGGLSRIFVYGIFVRDFLLSAPFLLAYFLTLSAASLALLFKKQGWLPQSVVFLAGSIYAASQSSPHQILVVWLAFLLAAVSVQVVLLIVTQRSRLSRQKSWLLAAAAIAPFFTGLSSNGHFIILAALALCLPLLMVLSILRDHSHYFTRHRPLLGVFAVTTALFMASIVYQSQIKNFNRNGSAKKQIAQAPKGSLLGEIYFEQDLANCLRDLDLALKKVRFNRATDRVVAAYDLPGLVSAFNLPSLGSPWIFTGYPNSDTVNCAYLALEPLRPFSRVFIIQNGALSPQLKQCLGRLIDWNSPRVSRTPLSSFYHYRNKKTVQPSLAGPYLAKRAASERN